MGTEGEKGSDAKALYLLCRPSKTRSAKERSMKRERKLTCDSPFFPFPVFVGRRVGSMWGTTPPCDMTTSPRSLDNSSSFLMDQMIKMVEYGKSQGYAPDGELQMPRHDTVLLVITSSVSSEFEDLSGEVLKDRSKVYYRHTTNVRYNSWNRERERKDVPGAPAPTRCA